MSAKSYCEELQLSIYKILKEINAWYNLEVISSVGPIHDTVRGHSVRWLPYPDGLMILTNYLSCGSQVSYTYKNSELTLTDLKFEVWPVDTPAEGSLEIILLGLIKLYAQFKDRTDAS